MKKICLLIVLLFIVSNSLLPQENFFSETTEQKSERMAWWTGDRFGMFIHWGVYATHSRRAWAKRYEAMTNEDYQKYVDHFNPDLYDPSEWARVAKQAGMKYAVITTKHHDGFCLFDSKYTDYKSTNTPIGKDLIKEWVEAFRGEGIKIGFYYSLLDWHHNEYTIDRNHPLSPTKRGEYEKLEESAAIDKQYKELNKGRDMDIYRQYVKNQLKEILTNYGQIDIIWLDYSFKGKYGKGRDDWDSWNLLKLVRELQPGIIINDRLDLLDLEEGWDFSTPEQYKVSKWPEKLGRRVPWETCQTISSSWGYVREESTWKDTKQLLVLLIETVSKGGNLILNIGPTGRGALNPKETARLEKMGEWMKYNNRSIYNCTEAPEDFVAPENSLMTYNPETRRLYIHLQDYPMKWYTLKGLQGKVKYAQFLHDASELQFGELRSNVTHQETKGEEDLVLILPMEKPEIEIPVIELILEDEQ